jgi:hypothetical protein
MFLRSFVLSLSVLFVTAIVTVSLVYAATYNAKCQPAKTKWVKLSGDCNYNPETGNCEGVITLQHSIVSFSCDTSEAGLCTESTVAFTLYTDTHSAPCIKDGTNCYVPDSASGSDYTSTVVSCDSCFPQQ